MRHVEIYRKPSTPESYHLTSRKENHAADIGEPRTLGSITEATHEDDEEEADVNLITISTEGKLARGMKLHLKNDIEDFRSSSFRQGVESVVAWIGGGGVYQLRKVGDELE